MSKADLTYNIPEEQLDGHIGPTTIDCVAGSGGRAGSKTPGAVNFFLQNNAFATGVSHGPHTFGPLPLGLYHMRPHEKRSNMVRLDPFPTNRMFGRSGFLIHGRGAIGSHGCIVPYDFNNVIAICIAVKHYTAANKKMPVLEVIASSANLDSKRYTA